MVTNKLHKILIIGGYGNVGSKVTNHLYGTNSWAITIAGRNLNQAKTFVAKFKKNVNYFRLDATRITEYTKQILAFDIVLSCVDLLDNRLARLLLENGRVYLDLSADSEYIRRVEALNQLANKKNGLAILSVGLMPGLSNLMVKHLIIKLKDLTDFEIFAQLGLGDKNGRAAAKWILNNINGKYKLIKNNRTICLSSFKNGKFEEIQDKKALFYPFNFSDQHTVKKTLMVSEAISYLGFDKVFVSRAISFFKRIGLFTLIRYKAIQNILLNFLTNLNVGSKTYRLKVKANDSKGNIFSISVKGEKEAEATAKIAYLVIHRLFDEKKDLPTGVKHIEELLSFTDLIDDLEVSVEELG